jgi:pimeloyl-ACP methyl ester carboxylesterase
VFDEVVEQIQVPGATLWAVSSGAGVPAVLCHGGPGLSDNLGPVATMVEDFALVHRYDQRGSGRSCSSGPFDRQPLYEFPRNEAVFAAASEDYKRVLDSGVEDQVRRLGAPVLVVHGAHDTEPARARQVAQLARNGRWVELEHSAHSPWLEEPAALREALREFVEGLKARS